MKITLDESEATCITMIAEASDANAKVLLGLLHGDARHLGEAIIAEKSGKEIKGVYVEMARQILTLVRMNQRRAEERSTHRKSMQQVAPQCVSA
jgi:hypothetical protein